MASDYPSAGVPFIIWHEGKRHELIIRTRKAGDVAPDTLRELTKKTVGIWLRVWSAMVHNKELDAMQAPEQAPEQALNVPSSNEPYVTVFNKDYQGVSITVVSSDNGHGALDATYALHMALVDIETAMPKLLQAPQNAPKQAEKRDINNVDSFLEDTAPQTAQKASNVYVRPAMAGSIAGTIKLEKGAKDKLTWETAILPSTPYSSNAAEFQAKDVIVYPIMGAIRYEGSSSGFYFAIPVPDSEIRVYVRDATVFEGKTIESDSQKLAQHLGLKNVELSQGMKWDVPATHIAMKVGKTGDKGQFKNYQGLYQLK